MVFAVVVDDEFQVVGRFPGHTFDDWVVVDEKRGCGIAVLCFCDGVLGGFLGCFAEVADAGDPGKSVVQGDERGVAFEAELVEVHL